MVLIPSTKSEKERTARSASVVSAAINKIKMEGASGDAITTEVGVDQAPPQSGDSILRVLPFVISLMSAREVVCKLVSLRKSIGTAVRSFQPFWKDAFEARFVGTAVHELLRESELSTEGLEWFLAYKATVCDVLHEKNWFQAASKKELICREVKPGDAGDTVPAIVTAAGLSRGRMIAICKNPCRVIAITLVGDNAGTVEYGAELDLVPRVPHYQYTPVRAIDSSHVLVAVSTPTYLEEEITTKPCLALYDTQSLTLAASYALPEELLLMDVTLLQNCCMTARHVMGLVEARRSKKYSHSSAFVTSYAELQSLEGEARDNATLDLGLYLCCWDRRSGEHVSMIKVAERVYHGAAQPYYSPSIFALCARVN